ncbi:MAG: hypothetical protein ACREMJ_04380 [Gemmatimonadales bacterium]
MQFTRILREGFVAGLIGAGAVAIWFLLVDLVNGRPFFTPAMLGSAVFWQITDPAQVVMEYSRIIGYTMIHVSAFVVVGVIAAAIAAEVEVAPPTLFLAVIAFCFFEVGFYILVALLARPLLGALAWWNVAIGNAIAAFAMGFYLWREHPKIGEELRRHPLGETEDGE